MYKNGIPAENPIIKFCSSKPGNKSSAMGFERVIKSLLLRRKKEERNKACCESLKAYSMFFKDKALAIRGRILADIALIKVQGKQ